ncbi:MAG: histidine--tRNA ligase [Pseudomonadota bacterium]
MSNLQPVRGTHDLLPDEMRRHRFVVDAARAVAEQYGLLEIATPIFEFTEVFKRTLGDTSDIVTKEMYTFSDRGGDEITLRPENTAGVARAVISGGLAQHAPLKFFYHGPMFRHERPQKGRLRQFHQIGVEIIGVAEPLADIEAIAAGAGVLRRLGVLDRTRLEINTLGDNDSRAAYRTALVAYFGAHADRLSPDSRQRLARNPLRILDSKDPREREIVAAAPSFADYLNPTSRDCFRRVSDGLASLGIAFEVNPRLVRGLDYYTHSAFEFTTEGLGAQGAVLAGGRYDGLIAQMGGPPTPGVGWAAGVERLAMLLGEVPGPRRPAAVVPVGPQCEGAALRIAEDLRRAGFAVALGYRGNLARRLKAADKLNARVAILIGEDERKRGTATLRDLDSGEQTEVPLQALKDRLAPYR